MNTRMTKYRDSRFNQKLSRTPYANLVNAGTVDSIQGQEKDVVTYSLVRTANVGSIDDKRVNVALSRCKKELWMGQHSGIYYRYAFGTIGSSEGQKGRRGIQI
jgi:hypothetical protein